MLGHRFITQLFSQVIMSKRHRISAIWTAKTNRFDIGEVTAHDMFSLT